MSDNDVNAYLGNGVYARFDGYGIWLTLNHHENAGIIYLEPSTLVALVSFAERIAKEMEP